MNNLNSRRINTANAYFKKHLLDRVTPIGTCQKEEDGSLSMEVFGKRQKRDQVIFQFKDNTDHFVKIFLRESKEVILEESEVQEGCVK